MSWRLALYNQRATALGCSLSTNSPQLPAQLREYVPNVGKPPICVIVMLCSSSIDDGQHRTHSWRFPPFLDSQKLQFAATTVALVLTEDQGVRECLEAPHSDLAGLPIPFTYPRDDRRASSQPGGLGAGRIRCATCLSTTSSKAWGTAYLPVNGRRILYDTQARASQRDNV